MSVLNIKMLTCSPNLTSGDGVTSEVGEESAAREAVGVLYADEGGMPSSPAPPPPLAEASLLVGVSPPPSPPDAAPAPRLPRLECRHAGNVTSKVYNTVYSHVATRQIISYIKMFFPDDELHGIRPSISMTGYPKYKPIY